MRRRYLHASRSGGVNSEMSNEDLEGVGDSCFHSQPGTGLSLPRVPVPHFLSHSPFPFQRFITSKGFRLKKWCFIQGTRRRRISSSLTSSQKTCHGQEMMKDSAVAAGALGPGVDRGGSGPRSRERSTSRSMARVLGCLGSRSRPDSPPRPPIWHVGSFPRLSSWGLNSSN